MVSLHGMKIATAGLVAALALGLAAAPIHAQTAVRGNLVVTGSPSPNPVSAGGEVTYSVNVKNDSNVTATGVLVTIQLPAGPSLVKCTPSVKKQPCTLASGVLSTTFPKILAHKVVKISVILEIPDAPSAASANLVVKAHADAAIGGEEPRDGTATIAAQVAFSTIPVVFLPSQRAGTLSCGANIGSARFVGSETTIQFGASLGCARFPTALTMSASGKTLDLKALKIVGAATSQVKGSVGIAVAPGATGVTILGGGTRGTSGIEHFDYCLVDGQGNNGLRVSSLRCFRARSAGVDVVSDGVTLHRVLVDRSAGGGALTTTEVPGGVGFRTSGTTLIQDSIARRTEGIGFWADGALDAGGTHHPTRVEGDSRVEEATGIGILLQGARHELKDVYVVGDGNDGVSTIGIQVDASEVSIDGVQVSDFAGNGVEVTGPAATIKRSTVEEVGGDSFKLSATAIGSLLSGNTAAKGRRGFVVEAGSTALNTNRSEGTLAPGFVVSGDGAAMTGNTAKKSKGNGFMLSGSGGTYETNVAEGNEGHGFVITGSNGTFKGNTSKNQTRNGSVDGIGYLITGGSNAFNTNAAEKNRGREWEIAPGSIDQGGNKKNGATFSFGGPTVTCTRVGAPPEQRCFE
jgi:uncharacterized repeat protein (TIGR01451 family)